MLGYKSQIEELKGIRTGIQNVLLDADFTQKRLVMDQAFTYQGWIESLKETLYNIDNLLDEFNTFALQQHSNYISQKVMRLLSRFNDFVVAFKMSKDLTNVKKKFDAITRDHIGFNLGDITYKPPRRLMKETGSYIRKENIIRRHREKEEVVSMLLDKDAETNNSFVSIVRIGGLGKTALAQLVYHDDRIISAFKRRSWVSVNMEDFSMDSILGKMLSSNAKSLPELECEFQQILEGKVCFFIFDNVWEDCPYRWAEFRDFLDFLGKGSKVLVTTRSYKVARAIRDGPMFELQGLSDEYSLELFNLMAFDKGKEHVISNVEEIGKDILLKCANVPLAIKVSGLYLRGQDTTK